MASRASFEDREGGKGGAIPQEVIASDGLTGVEFRMTRPWTEEYYDITEHYFWTSKALGHMPDPNRALKSPAEVLDRLRRIEEPLNHILGIFFALVPSRFIQELYRASTGVEIDAPLRLLGRSVHSAYGIKDATQPDFAFEGPTSFVTLEAKVAGRSSAEQLLKYAMLHWRVAAVRQPSRQALLYLSDTPVGSLFPGGFTGWASMKGRAIEALPSVQKQAFVRLNDEERSQVTGMLEALPVAHMTYAELDALMAGWETKAKALDADGVEAKLFAGMRQELHRRELVH